MTKPRSKALVYHIAAERMQAVLGEVVKKELRCGYDAWMMAVSQHRLAGKYARLLILLELRVLAIFLFYYVRKRIRKRFLTWVEVTKTENERLEIARRYYAAIAIQKLVRGILARQRVARLMEQKKFQKLYNATICIQAFLRGRVYRLRYLQRTQLEREMKARLLLQRVERGRRGRKRARFERRKQDRASAATRIQCLYRCKVAEAAVAALRKERRQMIAATIMQALVRGFLGRARKERDRRALMQERAAVLLQALFRGVIVRMNRARKRAELMEYRYLRNKAALLIQKLYRGYRGRVMMRVRMIDRAKKMKRLNKAAVRIQCMVRVHQARIHVKRLKIEQREMWIVDARKCQEMWSEESGTWFYLDTETNLAEWNPNRRGYIKADGRLVLANGEIIVDPRNNNKSSKLDGAKLCSECDERIAIRQCNECGDQFCTKCYKTAHMTGSRKKHTWTNIGPIDCSECEMKLAERWCLPCDEGFCDGCWRRVHSKGKRRFHPFSTVEEDGVIDPRIFTIDGEQVRSLSLFSMMRLL